MKRLFVLFIILMLAACSAPKTGPAGEPAVESKENRFSNLQAAMDSGLGLKCTFMYKGGKGEVIVKGDKFHTTATAEGQEAHSVSDGTMMYSWATGQPEGIKISMKEVEEMTEEQGQYGIFDAEQKIDYTCLPTVVSGTEFQPPKGMKFNSLKEIMEAMFS